jgi:hypothetical protein
MNTDNDYINHLTQGRETRSKLASEVRNKYYKDKDILGYFDEETNTIFVFAKKHKSFNSFNFLS